MSEEASPKKGYRSFFFIAIAIGVLVGGVLVVGSVQENRSFDQAIERVEELIGKDNFDAALRELDQAQTIKPDDSSFVTGQKNRIKSLRTSAEALAKSEVLIEEENYLAAMALLGTVNSEERGLLSRARELESEIRPILIENTETTVKRLIESKQYLKALTLMEETNQQLDPPKILQKEYLAVKRLWDEQKKAQQKSVLAKLRSRYDSFADVTWYQSSSSTNYRNANAFYLYFGMFDGEKGPLRLVVQYYDEDWLFIETAKVNVDGIVYTLNIFDWERDNDSSIWEWSDEPLDDRALIEAIINSRSAVIRFEGRQYYDTRTISSTQKAALKSVLQAWDLQP